MACLLQDMKTGLSRGYGFVDLDSSKETSNVLKSGHTIDGREVML